MKILIEKNYLKIKSDPEVCSKPFIISVDGKKEIDLLISYSDKAKNYIYVDVRRFKGKKIRYSYEGKIRFTQVDEIGIEKIYEKEDRPKVHFTAPYGHINDTNGLCYHEGKYHIFFQYYPYMPEIPNGAISYGEKTGGYACFWHRQNWGHLVTENFIDYTYYPIALHHNPTGSIWSGSGIVDVNNVSGLGDGKTPPILLFYTSCGDPTFVHPRKKFCQRMAYSLDGGVNFTIYPKVLVEHIEGANRDPKVVYCEELGKWMMALYLDRDDYSILTSDNLIDWQFNQKFSTSGENECPDFYPITADNGEKMWVYSGAHNHYIVGKWLGGKFTPIQKEKTLHYGSSYYAGQSFFGADKRINLCWLRFPYRAGENFSQGLSFPAERKLIFRNGEYFLTESPLEIENKIISTQNYLLNKGGITKIELPKKPLYIEMTLNSESEVLGEMLGHYFKINGKKSKFNMDAQNLPIIEREGGVTVKFIVDSRSVEVFAGEGECAIAVATKTDYSSAKMTLKSARNFTANVSVSEIKSFTFTELKA